MEPPLRNDVTEPTDDSRKAADQGTKNRENHFLEGFMTQKIWHDTHGFCLSVDAQRQ